MQRIRVPTIASIGFVLLLGAGFLIPASWLTILLAALSRSLVVLGLLILMRAGLVSFGQALFFAFGAYAAGLLALKFGVTDIGLRLGCAALSTLLLGLALGFLLRRYRAIFFAMLSLAFSMILYGLLVRSSALGSSDGFAISASTYLGWKPSASGERLMLYGLVCGAVWLSVIAVDAYLRSTYGRLAEAIRDNEVRVEYLGASVERAIHIKYVVAATLAGLGGAFAALSIGHVDPDMAFWTNSGEMVFVLILSGTGSVSAPILGSVLFEVIHAFAIHYSPQAWHIILGSVLLLFIVFAPGGLWSLFPAARRPA